MISIVTGGCGFIGSHLAEALVNRGETVRIVDNLSTGREENISSFRERVELIRADVRDYDSLFKAFDGADCVFHLAGMVSVFESVDAPEKTHEVNLTGTLNVLRAARARGLGRVLLASSCSVYGNDPALPKTEDMIPSPESPYAVTKASGEQYLRVFASVYGLETVSLRFFNVYGPRQDPSSMYAGVISKFMHAVVNGLPPVVFGDGLQTRDFVGVTDVVEACIRAMESKDAGGGAVYNVGTGKQTSLLDLLNTIGKITGRTVNPKFEPPQAGDVRHSVADISAAGRAFGYSPRVSMEEGLALLLESRDP